MLNIFIAKYYYCMGAVQQVLNSLRTIYKQSVLFPVFPLLVIYLYEISTFG